MIDFGMTIRNRRKKLGLTQTQLAEEACCCLETIYGVEHNLRVTRLDIIQDIFNVLGLELIVREVKKDD